MIIYAFPDTTTSPCCIIYLLEIFIALLLPKIKKGPCILFETAFRYQIGSTVTGEVFAKFLTFRY